MITFQPEEVDRRLIQLRIELDLLKKQVANLTKSISTSTTTTTTTATATNQVPAVLGTPGDDAICFSFDSYIYLNEIAGPVPITPGLTGKFTKCRMCAKTPSTTGTVVVDIQKSSDGGSTWNTILGAKITLAINTHLSGIFTNFVILTIFSGDMIRAVIDPTSVTDAFGLTVVVEFQGN